MDLINFDKNKHPNNPKWGMFSSLIDTNQDFAHHNHTFTPCSQIDLTKTTALYAIPELFQNPCNCFSDASQQNKCLSIATDLIAFKYWIHCSLTLTVTGLSQWILSLHNFWNKNLLLRINGDANRSGSKGDAHNFKILFHNKYLQLDCQIKRQRSRC